MGGRHTRAWCWPWLIAAALVPAGAAPASPTVPRGEYLTRAADCEVCHTAIGGTPYAGGLAIRTPFGTIRSSNITPDRATGIGGWSEAQFARAVRHGLRADGQNLYPAMPYTSYVGLSDDDVAQIWAYLRTLPPVHRQVPANDMGFPYNQRVLLAGWNLLNFDDRPFTPDPGHDAQWNRGAYLAGPLGHCQECHTPRNLAMGLSRHAYAGAMTDGWEAFNISSSATAGIGSWTTADLARYLGTGSLPGKATAGGGMAEVVGHSLRYLTADDRMALATYIKSLPPEGDAAVSRFAMGAPHDVAAQVRDAALTQPGEGARLYAGNCAACHGRAGAGIDNYAPALFHNSATGARHANNLVEVILAGIHRTDGAGRAITMPAFAAQLTDDQIAALADYVIDAFGPGNGHVLPSFVAAERSGEVTVIPGWLVIAAPFVVLALLVLAVRRFVHRRKPSQPEFF